MTPEQIKLTSSKMDSRCPHCRVPHDMVTNITDYGTDVAKRPKPGDAIVCGSCGCILRVHEGGVVSILTPPELQSYAESDPEAFIYLVTFFKFARDRIKIASGEIRLQ